MPDKTFSMICIAVVFGLVVFHNGFGLSGIMNDFLSVFDEKFARVRVVDFILVALQLRCADSH